MQEEEDNIQPVGRKHLPIEVHKQIVRKVSPSQPCYMCILTRQMICLQGALLNIFGNTAWHAQCCLEHMPVVV